jgi:uncharacterized OB-fold protein
MNSNVARYWRQIPQRYNLIGNQCGSCNKVFFPPRESCPYCRRKSIENMRSYKLSGKGEVITYTIIHVGPENFEEQVPYPVAIIKMDEGPQVTGQIVDCDLNEVKIGMRVETTFRRIQEDGYTGAIYYGYKFKKSNNE